MDILIRESYSNPQSQVRVQVLKLMETVLNNEVYREYNHRRSDVEEMINEAILYEEDETAEKKYSDAELQCIATIN